MDTWTYELDIWPYELDLCPYELDTWPYELDTWPYELDTWTMSWTYGLTSLDGKAAATKYLTDIVVLDRGVSLPSTSATRDRRISI
jgi:hypothetical protein